MQEKSVRFTYHKRLSELFSGPQAASGTIFRVIDGFMSAATRSLKWVAEIILRISQFFKKASQNFRYDFLNNKAT
jgi:hypothetical protein